MDRDSILQLSRQENENKQDEYALATQATANKVSYLIGSNIAALLSILGAVLFHSLALSAGVCTLLFSMGASGNIVKYVKLKTKKHLVWGVVDSVICIASFLSLFLLLR